MKNNIKITIIAIQLLFIYWLLFGGGELGSPSLGFKAMLWMAQ